MFVFIIIIYSPEKPQHWVQGVTNKPSVNRRDYSEYSFWILKNHH